MVEKYTIKQVLGFIILVGIIILIITGEIALFRHWDCIDEKQEECTKKSNLVINKDDCTHISEDIWICNTREKRGTGNET
ncbi:unnamed protein product [marine sediment metagenome]|uniref:Uncharacterized protein n=1 Tax=marine sediment metagenome TaxID=412755 RepID=X0U8T1_9ZZZZ